MVRKRPMKEYEVELKYVGRKRTPPQYTHSEYGFGMNPPVVLHARSVSAAKRQLDLPKTVQISKIKARGVGRKNRKVWTGGRKRASMFRR